ncbi:hypothetical protein DSM106972_068420 [Dulcicalothrix desertica PCC 7102]|uniref:Uncharacterized protein n=1 Tax=Dulcicalothrix desertica PCC 7102 TaxID=232991 RepID=A0A3S1C6P2_9CYAN|nr:hypothetical protein [Dulcicalothrix desertica]RUT01291.1 hypothetical protein DSM106972_068420 [Dulcicalothrix desertica PCC 7102]TWH40560.1 hypothetical protein CAL7102_09902 [Dulcicalothrix desertica PCC 7102]
MAWVFSLSAECGSEQALAQEFSQHFDGIYWTLSNGTQSQCQVSIFQDIEDNWWCRVCPSNISEVGVSTPETAYLMTELGLLLYKRLLSAPNFRYALVGVEVDEFRTYNELLEDLPNFAFPGLVLALSIWQETGSPQTFHYFSSGYVWKTYEGEVYKPLLASSDLKIKLNQLLTVQ